MCKHELEGVDYEVCDCCGEKAPCGSLYDVWSSQEKDSYNHWCQECKDFMAYKCHICGELFDDTTGHILTPADAEDGSQYYVCYECWFKEYDRDRDESFIKKHIESMNLGDIEKVFISAGQFDKSLQMTQLLALWTSYCLKYDYIPDTLMYDAKLLNLYNELNKKFPKTFIWRRTDRHNRDKDKKHLIDLFDLYMSQYLV